MKYVALLRGINVGGNTLIKMAELKEAFEELGFGDVVTYINSGNVVFESSGGTEELAVKIEKAIKKTFHSNVAVIVLTVAEFEKVMDEVPGIWKNSKDLRCYISFVKKPATTEEIASEINLREGVDSLKTGEFALYMTTRLSGLTKSGFNRFAAKKAYKSVTIRNYNTSKKILSLLKS